MPSLVEIGKVVLEKKILNFINVFSLFCNYPPLEKKEGPFIWTNLNSLTQGYYVPSLIEIASVVLFKVHQCYFAICYLPLESGTVLHLNKLESHSPRYDLCQVLLKLAQWFWRRRKYEKTTTITTTTDKLWSRKAHLSLRFRWAKNVKTSEILSDTWNFGLIGQYTISNGDLSDTLCDSVNRGLILVWLANFV